MSDKENTYTAERNRLISCCSSLSTELETALDKLLSMNHEIELVKLQRDHALAELQEKNKENSEIMAFITKLQTSTESEMARLIAESKTTPQSLFWAAVNTDAPSVAFSGTKITRPRSTSNQRFPNLWNGATQVKNIEAFRELDKRLNENQRLHRSVQLLEKKLADAGHREALLREQLQSLQTEHKVSYHATQFHIFTFSADTTGLR